MDGKDGRDGIAASKRRQRFRGVCPFLFEARRATANSVSRNSSLCELCVLCGKNPCCPANSFYCFQMTLPPTIVAAGPPLNFRPSNGELRDLLGEAFTS